MVKLPQDWKTDAPASAGASRAVLELTEADFDIEELDPRDPDLPAFLRERIDQKRREQKTELDVQVRQHQRDGERKADAADDRDRRLREWLSSEQYRIAYQQLTADIGDAQTATRWAYDRALKREQASRDAFEQAQKNALMVRGKRVYLGQDGQFHSEDGSEITDENDIAEANRQHRANPAATSYEEFVQRQRERDAAAQEAERLRIAIEELDRLEQHVKAGGLSPEELEDARREKDRIIQSLSPEARQEYERVQAVRQGSQKLSYRSPDPAFASAPDLQADFGRVRAQSPATHSPDLAGSKPQESSRAPAYRATPEF